VKRPERALILLKPQFLGDAVMAAPLLDAVAGHYAETLVSAGGAVEQLLADREGAVRFVPGRKVSGIGPVLRAARELREHRAGLVFLVNRSFRSALAARLAGIPMRVGHATEGRGFLLTHSAPYGPAAFEADCYLDLARLVGISAEAAKPRLTVAEEEAQAGLEALQGATLGVQPGARYPRKQIPLEVLAESIRSLPKEHGVALLGGPEEEPFVLRFSELLGRPAVNLVGKLPIRHTMGALSRLRAMVGSDTGLMHVAAAVGCPTVTVFGPNPASKWAHRYPPHEALVAPKGQMNRMDPQPIAEAARRLLA
jgi:heptosyltransferase II